MYIAYRRGNEMGWMLLSFDLTVPEVNLQIHQVLPLCQGPNGIDEPDASIRLTVFPNPNSSASICVEYPFTLRSLELLDPTGRVITQFNGTVRTIAAPEKAGTYFVRATDTDGRRTITRFIQQ